MKVEQNFLFDIDQTLMRNRRTVEETFLRKVSVILLTV